MCPQEFRYTEEERARCMTTNRIRVWCWPPTINEHMYFINYKTT